MPLKRTPPSTPVAEQVESVTGASCSVRYLQTASSPDLSTAGQEVHINTRLKRKREECDCMSRLDEICSLLSASTAKSESKFSALQAAISEISTQNAEIINSMSFLSQEYDDIKIKITSLESERENDRRYMRELEEKVEFMERQLYSTKIEIRNVPQNPEESKEDLCAIVEKTAAVIGHRIKSSEIKDVFRVKNKKNGSTTINVDFISATTKDSIVKKFEFSPIILGMMFVINGAVYALSAPCWGFVCDHHYLKPKYVIALGCVFVSGGFLLIGPAPFFEMETTPWVTVIGLVLHGLGMGSQLVASFTDALSTAIASGLPNSIETYGLVSGMWTSTFALGAFIGPTVSGLLFDSVGFRNSTLFIFILHIFVALLMVLFTCIFDRTYKMDVSVSAGDLLQIDGTLDESVLLGDKFPPPRTREKSRRYGISVEKSRPPAMNSLIACSSYKNRGSPWSQRTPKYRPTYGSLDTRYVGAYNMKGGSRN